MYDEKSSPVWDPNALELDRIHVGVNELCGRTAIFRNRVTEIFREFDGLSAEMAEVRAEIAALDRKSDLVLAALPTARD